MIMIQLLCINSYESTNFVFIKWHLQFYFSFYFFAGSDFFEDGLIPAHEKAPRPPNRKKHDEMLNELSTKIKELEDTRGKANERLRVTRDLASGLRDRRDRVSSEKADLEDRINVVNKAFEAKKDALQKLKWSYVINSEEALDQQVLFTYYCTF